MSGRWVIMPSPPQISRLGKSRALATSFLQHSSQPCGYSSTPCSLLPIRLLQPTLPTPTSRALPVSWPYSHVLFLFALHGVNQTEERAVLPQPLVVPRPGVRAGLRSWNRMEAPQRGKDRQKIISQGYMYELRPFSNTRPTAPRLSSMSSSAKTHGARLTSSKLHSVIFPLHRSIPSTLPLLAPTKQYAPPQRVLFQEAKDLTHGGAGSGNDEGCIAQLESLPAHSTRRRKGAGGG